MMLQLINREDFDSDLESKASNGPDGPEGPDASEDYVGQRRASNLKLSSSLCMIVSATHFQELQNKVPVSKDTVYNLLVVFSAIFAGRAFKRLGELGTPILFSGIPPEVVGYFSWATYSCFSLYFFQNLLKEIGNARKSSAASFYSKIARLALVLISTVITVFSHIFILIGENSKAGQGGLLYLTCFFAVIQVFGFKANSFNQFYKYIFNKYADTVEWVKLELGYHHAWYGIPYFLLRARLLYVIDSHARLKNYDSVISDGKEIKKLHRLALTESRQYGNSGGHITAAYIESAPLHRDAWHLSVLLNQFPNQGEAFYYIFCQNVSSLIAAVFATQSGMLDFYLLRYALLALNFNVVFCNGVSLLSACAESSFIYYLANANIQSLLRALSAPKAYIWSAMAVIPFLFIIILGFSAFAFMIRQSVEEKVSPPTYYAILHAQLVLNVTVTPAFFHHIRLGVSSWFIKRFGSDYQRYKLAKQQQFHELHTGILEATHQDLKSLKAINDHMAYADPTPKENVFSSIYFYLIGLLAVGLRAIVIFYSSDKLYSYGVALFISLLSSSLTLCARMEKTRLILQGKYKFDNVLIKRVIDQTLGVERTVLASGNVALLESIAAAYPSTFKLVKSRQDVNQDDLDDQSPALILLNSRLKLYLNAVEFDLDTRLPQLFKFSKSHDKPFGYLSYICLTTMGAMQALLLFVAIRFKQNMPWSDHLKAQLGLALVGSIFMAIVNFSFKVQESRASFLLLADHFVRSHKRRITLENTAILLFLIGASAGGSIYYVWYAHLIAEKLLLPASIDLLMKCVAATFSFLGNFTASYFVTRDLIKQRKLFLYKITEGQVETNHYVSFKALWNDKHYFTLFMVLLGYLDAAMSVTSVARMPHTNLAMQIGSIFLATMYAINYAAFVVNANVACTAHKIESNVGGFFTTPAGQPSLLQRAKENIGSKLFGFVPGMLWQQVSEISPEARFTARI